MPASESMERLAEQAVRAYDFPRPRLRLISSTENTVFAVDTAGGDRFVLRLHRPTADPDRVRSELLWLDALRRDTELVVPRPVRLRSGEWLGLVASDDLPEPRPFVAFRWIDGPLLNDRLDRTVFCRLGELTARLHHHARSFDGGPGFVRGRLDADSYRPEELPGGLTGSGLLSTADCELTRSAWAVVHDRVAGLGTGAGTFGLVHADLHQYNCLDVAGRLAPIDFDDCGFAHFAYDLAVPLVMTADRPDANILADGLLAGYRAANTSSEDPTEHVQTFVIARRIQMLGWIADNRANPELSRWADSFVPAALADLRRYLAGTR